MATIAWGLLEVTVTHVVLKLGPDGTSNWREVIGVEYE